MPYADKAKRKEYHSKYNKEHRIGVEQRRKYNLKHLCKKRGITVETYEAMLAAQGGVCALCKTKRPVGKSGSDALYIDHCHKTNKVRGLLCMHCNSALGMVDDNPFLLDAMAAYIRAHN